MRRCIIGVTALLALTFAAPALATPTAAVSIGCEGKVVAAVFVYTSNANNMQAVEVLTVDGSSKTHTVQFGTAGLTDTLTKFLPRDGKPHAISASTSVTGANGQTAEASDTATCSFGTPPCEVNCGPPPCKTNCGPPDPPCVGCTPPPDPPQCGSSNPDDPDCLPHTGPREWWEDRGTELAILVPFGLALLCSGVYLRRRYDG